MTDTAGTLLTRKQAAERLNCSIYVVSRLISRGSLPAVQVGGRIRIRSSDLDAYIKHNLNYQPKGRVSARTTEAIQKAILTKGAASPADFRDAMHSEPEELQKRRKRAAKKAKAKAKRAKKKQRKQRKKLRQLQQAPGLFTSGQQPCPTGTAGYPDCTPVTTRKGVFAAQLTKDGRSTFSADCQADMRTELERQLTSTDPAIREAAEKALAPQVAKPREDSPEYWRRRAEHPMATAADRIRFLANAEQLERRPAFTSSLAM